MTRLPSPVSRLPVLALALLVPLALPAQSPDERYQALVNELRCLVCQNQAIADSNAPLAADLREQVRAQIAAGRSDEEILRYVTDRYGDFVRYRPPLRPRTVLLWAGPFLLLAGAGAVALAFARRARSAPAAVADPQALERLLDEERRG